MESTGKQWSQSRADIERKLSESCSSGYDNTEINVKSGLQVRTTISHYPSPIFSVAYNYDIQNGLEYFIVNYVSTDGGESCVAEWKYHLESHTLKVQRKIIVRNCLKHLIWIPTQRAYVGYCDDMTLRGYKGVNMEEKVRVSVPTSALCIKYLDDWDELITAGQGHVISWNLGKIEFGRPIVWKEPVIASNINDDSEIWILRLSYVKSTKTLLAMSTDHVYFINMKLRRQVHVMKNTHDASLTHCAFYPIYSYLITAARDGSIHVNHTVVNALVHRFPAHRDGITGVVCMSTNPILISWSHATGCVRMWRLDTMELTDESSLSEGITALWLVRPNRLFYQTESEVRVFDINVLYTIYTSLSAPSKALKICWVKPPNVNKEPSSRDLALDIASKQALPSELIIDYNTNDRDEDSDNTRSRLICVLDDKCIVTVSPITGSLIHINYPISARDELIEDVVMTTDGTCCIALLCNGNILEYDTTVNPGKPKSIPKKKVKSIVEFERTYTTTGDDPETLNFRVVFFGCEDGYIELYHEKSHLTCENLSKRSINMDPVKIHAGAVTNLFMPSEGQILDRYTKQYQVNEDNPWLSSKTILISFGKDRVINIWQLTFPMEEYTDNYTIKFNKLKKIQLKVFAKFITAVDSVLLLAMENGTICMYKLFFEWKSEKKEDAKNNSDVGASDRPELLSLHSTELIQADYELRHKAAITSVSHSEIMKLFVTCGKNEMIKIWDLYGQLIRELNIIDSINSACFSNGRDLLVAYRNHIVRIEAQNFLPPVYLDEILEFDETFGIKDMTPELPMPMEGGAKLGICAFHPGTDFYDKVAFSPLKKEDTDKSTRDEDKRKLKNVRARMLRRRKEIRSKQITVDGDEEWDLEISDEEDEQKVVKRNLTQAAVPHRHVDRTVYPEFMIKRMKSWPVAPDGYIPNSVIRRKVKSIYPSYSDNYFLELLYGCPNDSREKEKYNRLEELPQEMKVPKPDKSGLVVSMRAMSRTDTLETEVNQRSNFDKINRVLRSVSKQKWCPRQLQLFDLEKGLLCLSRVLGSCSDSIALQIFASVLKIHEECIDLYSNPDVDLDALGLSLHAPGIPLACQESLALNTYPYFFNSCKELREMSGCILSRFHINVIQELIMGWVVPKIIDALKSSSKQHLIDNGNFIAGVNAVVAAAKYTSISNLKKLLARGKERCRFDGLSKLLRESLLSKGIAERSASIWTSYVMYNVESTKDMHAGSAIRDDSCKNSNYEPRSLDLYDTFDIGTSPVDNNSEIYEVPSDSLASSYTSINKSSGDNNSEISTETTGCYSQCMDLNGEGDELKSNVFKRNIKLKNLDVPKQAQRRRLKPVRLIRFPAHLWRERRRKITSESICILRVFEKQKSRGNYRKREEGFSSSSSRLSPSAVPLPNVFITQDHQERVKIRHSISRDQDIISCNSWESQKPDPNEWKVILGKLRSMRLESVQECSSTDRKDAMVTV